MADGGASSRTDPELPAEGALTVALSELAARVQRSRTIPSVLHVAGEGLMRLGVRLAAFQLQADRLVLRHLSIDRAQKEALEAKLGRPLVGLTATVGEWAPVDEVILQRQPLFRPHVEVLQRFLREATGTDVPGKELDPPGAEPVDGVIAPLFVREEPWGILLAVAKGMTASHAPAMSLFASQVGSSMEVAETIEALERANRALASTYVDLERTQQELLKRERLAALGEVAAVMAHEIRNPLGVLFNSISSLRRILQSARGGNDFADADLLLSIAGEESDRLNRIVSDLLDFANPHEPRFASCSLPGVLQDVVRDISRDALSNGVKLHVECAPGLPAVEMDVAMVRQALLNVVMNALQALGNRGSLTVKASVSHDDGPAFARIDVVDDGPGVPHAVRERIFEPFFTTKAFGTGLGLAVVKRIIESHRGGVSLQSEPQRTTVSIFLPLQQSRAVA